MVEMLARELPISPTSRFAAARWLVARPVDVSSQGCDSSAVANWIVEFALLSPLRFVARVVRHFHTFAPMYRMSVPRLEEEQYEVETC